MRFEVLEALTVTIAVLLGVTPCNLVDTSLSGYYSSTLKMEVLSFYETLSIKLHATPKRACEVYIARVSRCDSSPHTVRVQKEAGRSEHTLER